MITKIGIELGKKVTVSQDRNNFVKNKNCSTEPQKYENTAGKLNVNYFIPFTAKKSAAGNKYERLMFQTDTSAKKFISELGQEAKETGYDKITTFHVLRRSLADTEKYISDLNNGTKDYNTDLKPQAALLLSDNIVEDMFKTKVSRNKILPVIKEHIKEIDDILKTNKPQNVKFTEDVKFSDDLTDSVWSVREEKDTITPYVLIDGAFGSSDEDTQNFVINFDLAMKKALMHENNSKLIPLSDYEPKAKNVLKNLSLGTNIFITYDPAKEKARSFIDTVKQCASVGEYGKKFDITELNLDATTDYFAHVVNKLAKDKSKQHIVIANPTAMTSNDIVDENDDYFDDDLNSFNITDTLISAPSNVKFLFYDARDKYYSSCKDVAYSQFDEIAIPVLSTAQMIKLFKENPSMMKEIKVPFSKKAIEKTVEASAQLDGIFPDKTKNLMKKIAGYYIDKKEINEKDISNYVKEATNLFKKDVDDSSVDVVFDTGKRLKDMVGKSSTKKEAQLLVNQIKSNKLGTKGIILFSQDGSAGSGRRYTAKAIAGEARVPYIEMNAVDFGTKDVDLFGGGGNLAGESR